MMSGLRVEATLLDAMRAIVLICRARRLVGILTYGNVRGSNEDAPSRSYPSADLLPRPLPYSGWLSPGNPDPAATRIAVVRRALEENPYIEALFWE